MEKDINIIELKFEDTSISALAGNDYGYEEYKKQIKDKFDYNKKNEIIFPDYIKKVAISFLQGMFKDILKKINKNDVEKYIAIKASSEKLEEKILADIKF